MDESSTGHNYGKLKSEERGGVADCKNYVLEMTRREKEKEIDIISKKQKRRIQKHNFNKEKEKKEEETANNDSGFR